MPSREGKIIAHDANLSPYANCGRIFWAGINVWTRIAKIRLRRRPFQYRQGCRRRLKNQKQLVEG
jgi:hypothetical protein